MAIVGWNTVKERGVVEVTLVSEGPPTLSLDKYRDLIRDLIAEAYGDDVGALLLIGSPGRFCYGMDIAEIEGLRTPASTRGATALVQDLLNELESSPVSLISAVDGPCLGGGLELILAFHFVLASSRSTFGFPEIRFGTIPSYGGTQRLARIVGRNRALKILITGEFFDAQNALAWGLVSELASQEDLATRARKLAGHLARLSRPAVRALLRSTIQGLDRPFLAGLSIESMHSSGLAEGADLEEGIRAFLQKREPVFPSTLDRERKGPYDGTRQSPEGKSGEPGEAP
ncbi:MAG: enoyl-CoA hydratase/isomerase family protein [Deltaproteobacteria bacterium]|nr:enoyl-CoA hydratase/isomerase family protein [Deltaproteobacteria bacterium]